MLHKGKRFRITTESVRALIEETLQYEDENDGEKWAPEPAIVKQLREHFIKRPFDRIRLGLLKIESKTGLQWLVPNQEQLEILEYVEYCWRNELPCRFMVLKSRQIGFSTLGQAIIYCIMSTVPYVRGHLVADLVEKCQIIYGMWRFYYDNDAWWMRPELVKETNPVQLKDSYLAKSQYLYESAERREKAGRGFMAQINHFSEVDWWPADMCASIISSLLKVVPDEPGTMVMMETTGNMINGTFYKRFMLAYTGELGEYRAFFFEWFKHTEYKMPLSRGEARGKTAEEFFESLNDQDQELWTVNKLTAEQMNWYVTKRKEEMLGDDKTLDLFKREYPSSIDEAFLGANANFFDPNMVKVDAVRLGQKSGRKIVPLENVTTCSAPVLDDGLPRHYARCSLDCDELNLCRAPKLTDDNLGLVRIYERPRPGMPYVVTADSARGQLAQRNVVGSQDWDVIDVWRVGYIRGVDAPVHVQVAQLRGQGIGPRRLAQYMVALAEIYKDTRNFRRALMVPENNAHGLALIEEAKDLGAGSRMYQQVQQGRTNEPVHSTYGYYMAPGGGGKWALMTAFKQAYERGFVRHNAEISVLEMGTFANRDGKLQAIPPNHDDTVVTGALMIEGCKFAHNSPMPVEVECEVLEIADDDEAEFRQGVIIDIKRRRARITGKTDDSFDY